MEGTIYLLGLITVSFGIILQSDVDNFEHFLAVDDGASNLGHGRLQPSVRDCCMESRAYRRSRDI